MTDVMLVKRALDFATKAHAGQVRKYTGEPYITHPVAVAAIVGGIVRPSPEMMAAALLHDVIEDCGVKLAEIYREFGGDVALKVMGLTDPEHFDESLKGKPRAIRKAAAREWLKNSSFDVQTIKCADMITNTESIKLHDPKFWRSCYREEKTALIHEIRGDESLWRIAAALCDYQGDYL